MPSIDFPNSPAVNDVFTAGNSSYRWTGAAWVSNNLAAITWDTVSGKPATFPPSAHTHIIADTTGLQTALDGKAATSHTHVKANITDFAHTHAISEVTNLQTSLDGKAATVHTHAISDTTGLQTALDGKAATSHTHTISNVTGLQTALDGKAATVHTHAIADVTGLQTALDGKAATSHTHNAGQIVTTVSDKAAGYTIIAADENTFIRSTSATAVTMTIANVLNIGESVQFIQFGAGQITFAAGAGVNLRSVDAKLKTNKQYSVAAITCIASGEYLVTGDLVA